MNPRERQPYVGIAPSPDYLNRHLWIIGQENPIAEERWRLQHGRYLAGLGLNPDERGVYTSDEPDWSDRSMEALEREDDVFGSGIFDPGGRTTVHHQMGVFADHPSMPGYVVRNLPFQAATEIYDAPTGGRAVVMEVPNGACATCIPPPWNGLPEPDPPAPVPSINPSFALPRNYVPPPVPSVSIVNGNYLPQYPVTSVGEAPSSEPSGWGTYLVAGGLLGVAAAILMKARGK